MDLFVKKNAILAILSWGAAAIAMAVNLVMLNVPYLRERCHIAAVITCMVAAEAAARGNKTRRYWEALRTGRCVCTFYYYSNSC